MRSLTGISSISAPLIAATAFLAVSAAPAAAEVSVSYDVVCNIPSGKHTIITHFFATQGGTHATIVTNDGGVTVANDHSDQFQPGEGGDLRVVVRAGQTGTIVAMKGVPGDDNAAVIHWTNLEQLIGARC